MKPLGIGIVVSILGLMSPTVKTPTLFDAPPLADRHEIMAPKGSKCPEWWATMTALGWAKHDLETADKVMFRESRCLPTSHNAADPNTIGRWKGSLGLFQINLFWLQKTRYYPDGYLQTMGVAKRPTDLLNPYVNIKAALELFEYSERVNGCGWEPWLVSCDGK